MCLDLSDLDRRTLAKGEHLGFEWQIVHNGMGYRCGYVKVGPDHPWFEMNYNDIEAAVHGGLTFARHGKPCPTHGAADEWWVGFDCAHHGDRPDATLPADDPRSLARMVEMYGAEGEVRTTEYVRAECESLCEQALNLGGAR